ncbi:MAG: phage recombination protein Bet [Thermoplasmataceae archaeon]
MMQGSITDPQRKLIFAELEKIDMSKEDLEDSLEFSVKDLTKQDASDLISGLKGGKLTDMVSRIKERHAPKGGIYDAARGEPKKETTVSQKQEEQKQPESEQKQETSTAPAQPPAPTTAPTVSTQFAGWTREQVDLIKTNFAYGATDSELALFFEIARTRKMNPLLGEIKWVRRRKYDKQLGKWVETASIVIGIDGARRKAQESGRMDGIDVDVIRTPDGTLTYGIATLYLKGSAHPVVARAPFSEYCARDKDNNPTQFWRDKAETMIKKVAEFTAYRMAFAAELGGMYIEEEMQQAGTPINTQIEEEN